MKRWIPIVVALALALSAVEGIALAQGNQARVRAVHAVPNGPPLNVTVNGSQAFNSITFRDVTDYATTTSGTASIQVAPADSPESPVIDIAADLETGRDHSFAAIGMPDQIEPLLLVDDNSPPPQGLARVRFVHTSPNAPAVDVAQQGGNVLFSNVPYKGVGGYVLLVSGTYTLEIREAGTNNVLLTVPNVVLESCVVYTIWAMGLLNEQPPLEAVVSTDARPGCVPPPPPGATAIPGAGAAVPAATKAVTQVRTPTGPAATRTPTRTATGTRTVTATVTGTKTATATGTKTATATSTKTATATSTATSTATATATRTATKASPTATATATRTATKASPTATATATRTTTKAPPTVTEMAISTATGAATGTPAAARTETPSGPGIAGPTLQPTQPPVEATSPAEQPTSPPVQATEPPAQATLPVEQPTIEGGGEGQAQ